MSASEGSVPPTSRRKVAIACTLVIAAGVFAAGLHARRTRPDTFDASSEPIGAPPLFEALWSGEPIASPPLVLPFVERRELSVVDTTQFLLRRRTLDGLALPPHPNGTETDPLLLCSLAPIHVRHLPFIYPVATEAAGRYFAFARRDAVMILDLADGRLHEAWAAPDGTAESGRNQNAIDGPPALSRLVLPNGTRVETLAYGGPETLGLSLRTGDEPPNGRRVRAREVRGRPGEAVRLHVEVVDVATGGVVASGSETGFAVANPGSWWAVDVASLSFGRRRGGRVHVAPLAGVAGEPFQLGDGDVTALAATSSGFVTGHQDGSLRRWSGRRSEVVVPAGNGRIARIDVYDDRVVATRGRPRGQSFSDRVTLLVGDLRYDVEVRSLICPSTLNDRWLCFTGPDGGVAVGERGRFDFAGDPVLVVGDWVVTERAAHTAIVDLSGEEPRVIAEVPGLASPPTAVRGVEGGFLLRGIADEKRRLLAPGLSLEVSTGEARWNEPTPSWVRPPAVLPTAAGPLFAQAFAEGRLHECPRSGLLTLLDDPEGLVTWDPAAPQEQARRFRRWKGAVTEARLLVSRDGDRFVVPSWELDLLRFGDFARGLAADAAAPLVGPRRGDAYRKDKLHDGEVGGRPERGARFAFVANDAVAVCEPDAVRLRHVPTGRDLGRLADPAECLCVSPDGATLLLVADSRVAVLRRR